MEEICSEGGGCFLSVRSNESVLKLEERVAQDLLEPLRRQEGLPRARWLRSFRPFSLSQDSRFPHQSGLHPCRTFIVAALSQLPVRGSSRSSMSDLAQSVEDSKSVFKLWYIATGSLSYQLIREQESSAQTNEGHALRRRKWGPGSH